MVAAVSHKQLADRPLSDYLSKLQTNATVVDVKVSIRPDRVERCRALECAALMTVSALDATCNALRGARGAGW
jgi:hypothetical protein